MTLLIVTALLSATSVFAADHPCKQIVSACESAGFTKGKHKEQKGLFLDCVQPIKQGKTVAGVTVDPSVVQACNAKKAKKSGK